MYTYRTRGVCARAINVEIENDKVVACEFVGGCPGNGMAVSKLVKGMKVDDIAAVLEGNRCGGKPTSCGDQLVKALREAQASA